MARLFFTTFPSPAPTQERLNRSTDTDPPPQLRSRPLRGPLATPADDTRPSYYWFTIDHSLTYLSFFEDWGPLNLAMVFKACILIHELLEDKEMLNHRLVLYASSDPRRKANAALLMALYVMIVQRRAPWEAFHPIAEMEFMPFRDAGRGRSDFNLSIQDCLWGIWKAMQNGLCDMNQFSVEDYEYYEKVENGDWNWLTPNFIAFASPVDPSYSRKRAAAATVATSMASGSGASAPSMGVHFSDTALQRKLPTPFINCLKYFSEKGVKLVVRLNNALYDKSVFEERGLEHLELYFDDGTNPTDEIVRKFIQVSDPVVEAGGVVAVHCKAGLGRTGTLVGAYLIWKYGFTANEAIAFMRIVRPGCVVGPQQQYMYLKQLEWSKWAAVDELRKTVAVEVAATAAASASAHHRPATPPSDGTETKLPPVTPSRHAATVTDLPVGQPRKTPTAKRTLNIGMIGESEEEEEDEDEEMNGADEDAMDEAVSPDEDDDPLAMKVEGKPKPAKGKGKGKTRTSRPPSAMSRPGSRAANTTGSAASVRPTTRATRSATIAATGGTGTSGSGNGPPPVTRAPTTRRAGVASASKAAAPYRIPRGGGVNGIARERTTSDGSVTTGSNGTGPAGSATTTTTTTTSGSGRATRSTTNTTRTLASRISHERLGSGTLNARAAARITGAMTPSRLPTLIPAPGKSRGRLVTSPTPKAPNKGTQIIPSKRSYMIAESGGTSTTQPPESHKSIRLSVGPAGMEDDTWMTGAEAGSVVQPGTKSLRSVRRRRSSFSSADVVA